MDNVQTQENFFSEPSSQIFKSDLPLLLSMLFSVRLHQLSYISKSYFKLFTASLNKPWLNKL
jgi:hypothetical protein